MFRPISWAVYLAMSWTWCIGMFLPVILVSEFGIGAWFVFAIPNIVGAAAMGWTLSRPGASERIVAEHRTACVVFSAITIAFQIFFLVWMTMLGIVPWTWTAAALWAGAVYGLGFAHPNANRREWLVAWCVLGVSLTVMARGLMHPVMPHIQGVVADRSTVALLCLAPVCIFGFLLCPYLDLTFHRAKQSTSPGEGRLAFTLGFGFFFLLMILLTLLYERDLSTGDGTFGVIGIRWVAMHMAVQIGFTCSAHLRALPGTRRADGLLWLAAGLLLVAAMIAMQQQHWAGAGESRERQMSTGELVYRLFMSFYGLVFPAYVWVCMVPIFGRAPGPTRSALIVWGLAVLIAAPMFWLGFIDEEMPWLIGGVAVVLGSRALGLIFGPGRQASLFHTSPVASPVTPGE